MFKVSIWLVILKCLIVTCARTREPAQGLSDLRGSKTGITYQYLPPQSGQVYQQNIPFGLDQSDPTGFQQNVIPGYQVLRNPQQNAFAKSNLPRNTVAKSNPQQNALGYPGVTATQTIPGLAQPQGEFSGKALLVPINMPYGAPSMTLLPPLNDVALKPLAANNPLLAAYILASSIGIHPKAPGFNHPQHLPVNPYLALLLSHYGRYIPVYGVGKGIYGYAAANNYHNNKPFGAYKVYEDRDD